MYEHFVSDCISTDFNRLGKQTVGEVGSYKNLMLTTYVHLHLQNSFSPTQVFKLVKVFG